MARRYFALFVNRLAYTLQSHKPGANGKHYYYRPKQDRRISPQTIREHLNGQLTIGIYALNPKTQRSKWVAIDADYENALDDLLKLQWELRQDGVDAALEKSRRGAHLWIFADKPLLARHCRIYIYNLALRLKVPVKGGSGLAEGISWGHTIWVMPFAGHSAYMVPAEGGTVSTAKTTVLKPNSST